MHDFSAKNKIINIYLKKKPQIFKISKLFVWHSKWHYTVRLMKKHKHFLLLTWMLWKAKNVWLDEEKDKKKWKQRFFLFLPQKYIVKMTYLLSFRPML